MDRYATLRLDQRDLKRLLNIIFIMLFFIDICQLSTAYTEHPCRSAN